MTVTGNPTEDAEIQTEAERALENQELKDMVKDLRDTHKQDVKTQTNLLKSIDRLMRNSCNYCHTSGNLHIQNLS